MKKFDYTDALWRIKSDLFVMYSAWIAGGFGEPYETYENTLIGGFLIS